MANQLRITELDFDAIKQNLKTFLKQQDTFADYDFEGSNLSILLDILAYNTHYNAFYLNMVANESFMDTALLRDSVVSHAKTLGYIPYSVTCPVAQINFIANTNNSNTTTLTIPAGYTFKSNLIDSKSYNFVVLEDATVTKSNTSFFFDNLSIYGGTYQTYNFIYDSSTNLKQIFDLPDTNIDTRTLKVRTPTNVYENVTEVLDVDAESKVYFLQEGKSGIYQIYFGKDNIGKSLTDGEQIIVSYIISDGPNSNKANNYIALSSLTDSSGYTTNDFIVNPIYDAIGGSDRESVDSIKLSSVTQFPTQNRLVTTKDYESYLMKNYPSVESVTVWGGEDEYIPAYGKVYLSLKPKANYYISQKEKQNIINNILKPKVIVGTNIEIIDPQYLYIIIDCNIQYNSNKTILSADSLINQIKNAIVLYNNTYLNQFSSSFVSSKLQENINKVDLNSIKGCELNVKLQKRFEPELGISKNYIIDFSSPLKRGTAIQKLISSEFNVYDKDGIIRKVTIDETPDSHTGISEIQIVESGIGYTTNPKIIITGDGTGATAEPIIVNGKLEKITITNPGTNYTTALVTVEGGNGHGAVCVAALDYKKGILRMSYFDNFASRQIISDNIGEIFYDTGIIVLNDLRIISLDSNDSLLRLTAYSEKNIVDSNKNTIISVDIDDPTSILIKLVKI